MPRHLHPFLCSAVLLPCTFAALQFCCSVLLQLCSSAALHFCVLCTFACSAFLLLCIFAAFLLLCIFAALHFLLAAKTTEHQKCKAAKLQSSRNSEQHICRQSGKNAEQQKFRAAHMQTERQKCRAAKVQSYLNYCYLLPTTCCHLHCSCCYHPFPTNCHLFHTRMSAHSPRFSS